jgi:cellobiose-specific phosphotransferase system component IIA
MINKLVLFPLPHIISINDVPVKEKQVPDTTTIEVEDKKYTVQQALDKIESMKSNISDTRMSIDAAIESLKNGNFDEAIKNLEVAEEVIDCPRCKNKFIVEQARINVVELACSVNDNTMCTNEVDTMITELEGLSLEYMDKVEGYKIRNFESSPS